MRKKTPLPAKITSGIAVAGMIVLIMGVIKEKTAVSLVGFALTFVGFFGSFVVSMIMDIKKLYPSREDPFQRKMRVLRYIRLIAGCTSFLSVGLVMYALYTANRMTKLLYFALSLIVFGIVVFIVISVIMAVMSKISTPRDGANAAVPPSDIAVSKIPFSSDPVISRILATPYVLLDERIRQIHDVQNLLQYPEIQQIFFEPTKLYELFANERVGELLSIIRDWITRNNADEIFAAAERRRLANMPMVTVQTDKNVRSGSQKKSSAVFAILFIAVWLVVFISIAFTALGVAYRE